MKLKREMIVGMATLFLWACAAEKPVEKLPPAKESAEIYFKRGVDSSEKREYKKAVSDYNKAVETDPGFVVAYLNRGFTYSKMGEYEKAISDYDKAIEINPRYAKAYNNRGLVYRKMGEYDKAISDYTKAIEIDPKYALAYYNRGHIYHYNKGDYEKAWVDIKKARSLGYKVPSEFFKNLQEAYDKQKGPKPE